MLQVNKEQQDAIGFGQGVLLLLAGPGSGKTFVLTHRIKALIESGVDSSHILVITFTKAAAIQMRDRFSLLCDDDNYRVTFGTFHAIFYSILKNHNRFRDVVPITDKEKINMVKRALEIAGLDLYVNDFDAITETLSLISACKNNGNKPAEFMQNKFEMEEFISVFNAYQDLLFEFKKIDFDDMINLCLELLNNDNEYLKKWQKKYEYILVDEFQDISGNQYELVKLLAYPQNNIFAVGDDDQSIYRFRGARVELMKSLLTDFEGAQQMFLSVNYRSTPQIVEASLKVINNNKNRFFKNIKADKDSGLEVKVINKKNIEAVYTEIIALVNDLLKRYQIDQIALLVRTNRQGAKYAALFEANNIEYVFSDKHVQFSESFIKDICAYMEFANGNHKREVFLRFMNKPLRYITRKAIGGQNIDKKSIMGFYSNDISMQKRIELLFNQLERLKSMSPYLAVHYIRKAMGYDLYIKDNFSADFYESYIEVCNGFMNIIKKCRDYTDVKIMLEKIREKSEEKIKNTSGIHIMTYHGSKGLEYDAVLIPDVNEGVIPSKTTKNEDDKEEERRMFYVSMTRAKEELYIFYSTENNMKPSSFISPLLFS